MSQVNTNAIYDASGGQSAKLYGPSMRYGGTAFVNRIINGDMRIDQRNAGASVTVTSSQYVIDRWRSECSSGTGGAYSVQQSSVAPVGFNNSALITVTTADASIGSMDFYDCQQFIEGFNVADLGWGTANAQTVTISFWVRSSVTGTFAGSVGNSAADRSYVFTYVVSAANTFEYKTVTIPGDTAGTWLTNNRRGIALTFDLGNGSSYQAAAGSWVGQYAVGTSSSVKLISTSGATFYITGVQLEAGSVASPFERRDYGRELMMCQRYYERRTVGSQNNERLATTGLSNGATLAQFPIQHLIEKRATPSVNVGNLSGTSTYDGTSSGSPTSWGIDNTGIFITNIQLSGLNTVLGRAIHWAWNNTSPTPFVEISSEL